jgi:AcrR family transcriptional regulator
MATRAVATTPDEEQDDDQHYHEQRDDPGHLYPAGSACGRFQDFGVGAGRLGHVDPSLSRSIGDESLRDRVSGCNPVCLRHDVASRILGRVPRLWNATIEEHRRTVRDATLDTTAELVARHGLRSVTMSQIAEETGIGRATLYKYFPDVEAILVAWHERQIAGHLEHLAELRDRAGDARERLEAVLGAYAFIQHEHHGTELAGLLHGGKHVARAQQHLRGLIRDLLAEGADTGHIRDDVAPDELAGFCLHALTAASGLPSKAAVRRLVSVTIAGLHPARD